MVATPKLSLPPFLPESASMRGLGSAARPHAGVARRTVLVCDTVTAGDRAVGMKLQRGVATVSGRERESLSTSSARRASPKALSVPKSTVAHINRAAGVSRRVARAAPVHDVTATGERAIRKRPQSAAPAAPRQMARDSCARRPDVDFSDRKRVKVTHNATNVEVVVLAASVKMAVNNAQNSLKKRLAAELDALRELVKKAEALSAGNKWFVATETWLEEAPLAKRIKTSPLVEQIDMPRMSPEEGEIMTVDPEEEEIDICGCVSPVVAIRDTSPLVLVEEASSSEVESPAPAALAPKETNSPAPPAENVTSREPLRQPEPAWTVQSTEPEGDSDESVSSPAPSAALPNKIGSPALPPKPAASVMKPETKVQGNQPISILLARAKEAYEIRQQKGNGWEREKVRREVREMEKAVLPDETIHPQDLKDVGIMEFGYVLGQLGIFLRQ